MSESNHDGACDNECFEQCSCGRGTFKNCTHRSCWNCYLDRCADYVQCILCSRWHSPDFDTCFKCRPETRGRDDAARALRQLILWRDGYRCQYCGATEGDALTDPRLIRPACWPNCAAKHKHLLIPDDGLRYAQMHVDHVVPCAKGGLAVEWNLQALCQVCNIGKGATWYPGCRHDRAKTHLVRKYFLMGRTYFEPEERARFLADVAAYRATETWDPASHDHWRASQISAGERAMA